MREHATDLDRLQAQVYAVTFESAKLVAEYQRSVQLPFPILCDPQRTAYWLFGLGRGRAVAVWGPSTLLYYGMQLLRGRMPHLAKGSDQYQLGGDVIIRPGGDGGMIYRSANPADRPSVTAVLRAMSEVTR